MHKVVAWKKHIFNVLFKWKNNGNAMFNLENWEKKKLWNFEVFDFA